MSGRSKSKSKRTQKAIKLSKLPVDSGENKSRADQLILVWTPAKVDTASRDNVYIDVGWTPTPKKGKKANPRGTRRLLSQAPNIWKENYPDKRHSKDTVFIHDIPYDALMAHFADSYKNDLEDPKGVIPIMIDGPLDDVVRNLQLYSLIPRGAAEQQIYDFIEDVAFTATNYDEKKSDFKALVEEEPVKEKGLERTVLAKKDLEDIMSFIGAMKDHKVDVLDVNGKRIGRYGKPLKKSVRNIFTDRVVKKYDSLFNSDGEIVKVLLITNLASEHPKVSIGSPPAAANISEGEYGNRRAKPLLGKIVLTVDRKKMVLPPGSIWTEKPAAVDILYAEMDAVNEAVPGSNSASFSYKYTKDLKEARSEVTNLIKEQLRKNVEKESNKGGPGDNDAVEARDVKGRKKKKAQEEETESENEETESESD